MTNTVNKNSATGSVIDGERYGSVVSQVNQIFDSIIGRKRKDCVGAVFANTILRKVLPITCPKTPDTSNNGTQIAYYPSIFDIAKPIPPNKLPPGI